MYDRAIIVKEWGEFPVVRIIKPTVPQGAVGFKRTLRDGAAARRGYAAPRSLAGSRKGFDHPLGHVKENRHPARG